MYYMTSTQSYARRIQCPYPGCKHWLKSVSGLKVHQNSAHGHSFTRSAQLSCTQRASVEEIQDEGDTPRRTNTDAALQESKSGLIHDYHDLLTGRICDENGNFLDPSTPPPPYTAQSSNDWTPYHNRLEFECAEFMYTKNQMSAGDIDKILHLWGVTLAVHNNNSPFADHRDLYKTIDATPLGDVAWQSFSLQYNGNKPAGQCPLWMEQSHEVWFRDPHTVVKNMLANPDFKHSIDYMLYRESEEKGEQHHYKDFMSGDWAWQQVDQIVQDLETHGAAFVPIIVSSDKTAVSVATGQNDYYPLYLSIGNVHNNIWCSHRNALALIGFLAIPKTEKKNADDARYHKFKKQLFHSSLSKIFATLKPGMTTPEVTCCGDGHHRRILYGLGPYIADYEEQVVLAFLHTIFIHRCLAFPSTLDDGGVSRSREHTDVLVDLVDFGVLWDEYGIIGELVPFTNDFPCADNHELLAPNILHQLIKGTFKDHLVEWVWRGFFHWTGDDSKALMKVYIPAIEGHVPDDMVRAFRSLLEFCYIARANVVTDETLAQLRDALRHFHILVVSALTFPYPCQHSLTRYKLLIQMFGTLNGLCSSITESKHIKAVKEPWWRSNRYNALLQMLLTNQRLDKIAASRVDFAARGMLKGSCAFSYFNSFFENRFAIGSDNGDSEVQQNNMDEENNPFAIESDDFDDVEDQGIVDDVDVIADVQSARTFHELKVPSLPTLIRLFLYDQIHTDDHHSSVDVPLCDCPSYMGAIKVFNSAAVTFIAPSDPSGITGMHHEHLCAVPSWRNGPGCFDCAFVNTDDRQDEILSMDWFYQITEERDEATGMYMVAPSFDEDSSPNLSIIHIDSIVRGAHLLPIFGTQFVPRGLRFHHSLDVF
ncbi:uncharacterized protein F5891DRAFT_1126823 [Suillus fuscotomentosus]|uniref:C2H2-type domain-containing protein n=1 Tax=Suillus fuscotomentosus TaxID=1912939 RepID=A0AAD4ECQ8_9AGAM|nr:uncharacterized protein F5891DRAFT_1126823 [Suillus fuscotomentosus]KAG1903865.1 hypothetical protein F5891DRAFT_1126823 [Suillus fuscotomentosus]